MHYFLSTFENVLFVHTKILGIKVSKQKINMLELINFNVDLHTNIIINIKVN